MKKYISRILLSLLGFLTVGHHLFWSLSKNSKKFNFADLMIIPAFLLIDIVFFIILGIILVLGVIIE